MRDEKLEEYTMKSIPLCAIGMSILMIATIPIAAGATNEQVNNPQTTDIFGWVIIRGFVFAWKEYGNEVHVRAIRVHYTAHTIGGTIHGMIKGGEIIFKDRFAFDQIWSGPLLGLVKWIFGIYHGSIEIKG